MKNIYLALALIAAIIPYIFFAQHFGQVGFVFFAFVQALFANLAAAGFTAGIVISSLVFWIAIVTRRRKGPQPWLFVVLDLTIGLSCVLPAYLYVNEKKKNE